MSCFTGSGMLLGTTGRMPLDVFMAACMSVRLEKGTSVDIISHKMTPKLYTSTFSSYFSLRTCRRGPAPASAPVSPLECMCVSVVP